MSCNRVFSLTSCLSQFSLSWLTGISFPTDGLNLPVIQEEAVLEENVYDEVDKAFHSHAKEVLPEEAPVVRVGAVVFTWGARDSRSCVLML